MRLALSLWTLFFAAVLAMPAQTSSQTSASAIPPVKVWQATLPLAASDEGPPDENPNFDTFAQVEDYPYTMRTDILGTETVHPWQALYLENEYLKCTILPQLGGHIYTCIDKLDGQPMFNANPTFKKAIIAYRGAWAAFGEEFDFPVSHNWVTISPIDWAYSTAPDGSASVTVHNRDRVYGMDWTVQIVLRPGSTLVEEHVTLSNLTNQRHHYFWWNNAGIQVWPDSRIYIPMRFTKDNGSDDIDTWPVNSAGVDLGLVSKHKGDFEAFAFGSREPFMGVYSPHTASGVAHWADPATVPSKKVFAWGNDDNAAVWRHLLSDNNSAYIELQSGLFKDQTTYQFLEPGQSVRFTEYWMPVRAIGSITRANLSGVLSMQRTKPHGGTVALNVGFNANRAIPSAHITVSDGTQNVFEETASLSPAVTWTHQLPNLAEDKTYTFQLTSATGETLLKQTEGVYDDSPPDPVRVGPHPAPPAPDPKSWTAADFFRSGNDIELQGDYLNAWDAYQSGLAKFPASPDLLKAAGRLADHLWRYDQAAALLTQAEQLDPSDAETHFYRAIAEIALAHPADARTDLTAAQTSPAFGPPASLLLAELTARQHDIPAALKLLESSCPATNPNPADLRCIEETVALQRTTGNLDAARTLTAQSLALYPTSLFLRNEAAKLAVQPAPGSSAPNLDYHLAADTSRILNLVLEYNRLGLYADSLDLLTRTYPAVAPEDREPAAPTPANDPILAYYRGFCRQQLGQSPAADYAAASQLPLLYVFPSQPDELNVLRAALALNPSDASAHYLLGMLDFSKGIVDPALAEWKTAESLNPHIPSLQASVGRVLLGVKKQPAEAAAEFQRGLQLEPTNSALYLGLNDAMQQLGRTPIQRANMMMTFPDPANMSADLIRALVDALRAAGKDSQADDVLAHRFIPRKEGQAPLQPQK